MMATSPLFIQSSSTVEVDATPTPTVPSPTVPPSSSTSTYESVPSLPLVVDLSLLVEVASIVPPQPSLRHSQPPTQHLMLTRSRDGTRKGRTFLAMKDPVPQSFFSILSASSSNEPTSYRQALKDDKWKAAMEDGRRSGQEAAAQEG
ncbi:hypothetical protein ACH5RR_022511 [Cinchona calisaya]|uniref:Uncharacterized protein n=1 Tax=Cinchona calisaya TaxID=153742 RepID=A0ABD2Z810_9GENT